jgi:hypothetical protein
LMASVKADAAAMMMPMRALSAVASLVMGWNSVGAGDALGSTLLDGSARFQSSRAHHNVI